MPSLDTSHNEPQYQVDVEVTTADSRGFMCTRTVLHALLASLHLTYSAVLWHVPLALYELGSFGRYWGTEEEWDMMINVTRLLSQLGILYICFGYLEASCSRQTGKTPFIHRLWFTLLGEGLLACSWIYAFQLHGTKMMTLARYDNGWLTMIPVVTAISICICWIISLAHLLVPFVHRLSLEDKIPVMELLGRGVEDYPWPVEEAQIQIIADQLTIMFEAEEAHEADPLSPVTSDEKRELVAYDLV